MRNPSWLGSCLLVSALLPACSPAVETSATSGGATGSGGAGTATGGQGGSAGSGGSPGTGGTAGAPQGCVPLPVGLPQPAQWGRVLGAAQADLVVPVSLHVSGAGRTAMVGKISGKVDFGAAVLDGPGTGFLAGYGPDGAPGPAVLLQSSIGMGVVMEDSGDAFAFSEGNGALLLESPASGWGPGGSTLPLVTATPPQFAALLAGPMARRADGKLIVAGVGAAGDLGVGQKQVHLDGVDFFVAALDPSGDVAWATAGGLPAGPELSPSAALVYRVAVGAGGHIAVAGRATHALLTNPPQQPPTADDTFVAALDAGGTLLWSHRLPATGKDQFVGADGLAVDPSGRVVLSGSFNGAVDLGQGEVDSAGAEAGFLVAYDAAGVVTSTQVFAGHPRCVSVAGARADGTIAILGGGADGLVYTGTLDAAAPVVAFTRGHAVALTSYFTATLAPSGAIVVAGYLGGTSDLGGGPVPVAPAGSPFIAALAP